MGGTDAGGNKGGDKKKNNLKKQRKAAGRSLDFSSSDRGNAEQLVDPLRARWNTMWKITI